LPTGQPSVGLLTTLEMPASLDTGAKIEIAEMKASIQINLLSGLGSVLLLCSVFERKLGLPEWAGWTARIGAIVCFCLVIWVVRRAKKRGDLSVPGQTRAQYDKRIRLALIMILIMTLATPFWLPYTGVNLPLPVRIGVALVSAVIAVAAVLLGVRLFRPKS
jgi:hypothetical protein